LQDAINTYYAVRMDSKNGGSMANDGKKFFHLKIEKILNLYRVLNCIENRERERQGETDRNR
jgi:hypothetical protein